jgi:hypothetical protein
MYLTSIDYDDMVSITNSIKNLPHYVKVFIQFVLVSVPIHIIYLHLQNFITKLI